MLDDRSRRLAEEGDRLLGAVASYVVDVEIESSRARPLLRFFIDRTEGPVTVEHCARASRILQQHLEDAGTFGTDFALEVSSPGIERRVARPRDFCRFAGSRIRIRLASPVEGRRNLEGVLAGADEDGVVLDTPDRRVELQYSMIARANLAWELPGAEG